MRNDTAEGPTLSQYQDGHYVERPRIVRATGFLFSRRLEIFRNCPNFWVVEKSLMYLERLTERAYFSDMVASGRAFFFVLLGRKVVVY
jgi:hypothetical protein